MQQNDETFIIEEDLRRSIIRKEDLSAINMKKAEQIQFQNTPSNIIITDQYGFIKDKNS
jgi:hypothetical protein